MCCVLGQQRYACESDRKCISIIGIGNAIRPLMTSAPRPTSTSLIALYASVVAALVAGRARGAEATEVCFRCLWGVDTRLLRLCPYYTMFMVTAVVAAVCCAEIMLRCYHIGDLDFFVCWFC